MVTRTRVACVVVFVMDLPLNSGPRVLVLMAWPNLERMARELGDKLNKNLNYYSNIKDTNSEKIN
jgi:hypothetical protein